MDTEVKEKRKSTEEFVKSCLTAERNLPVMKKMAGMGYPAVAERAETAKERAELIGSVLCRLEYGEQFVIRETCGGGYRSAEAAAKHLGVSRATVYRMKHHALDKLAEMTGFDGKIVNK